MSASGVTKLAHRQQVLREAGDPLEGLVVVSGAPRSGTTLAIRCVAALPDFLAVIDDQVWECHTIYDYQSRRGIAAGLRDNQPTGGAPPDLLRCRLERAGAWVGIAETANTQDYPNRIVEGPLNPQFDTRRCSIPGADLSGDERLVFKSPEVSFVIPKWQAHFPTGRLVLLVRPVLEVAASMWRMANRVKKVAVYQQRWQRETRADGSGIAPPGIPADWTPRWNTVSSFGRGVIYAAAYERALLAGLVAIPATHRLILQYRDLASDTFWCQRVLASFLETAPAPPEHWPAIANAQSACPAEYLAESRSIIGDLGADETEARLVALEARR
ncbi:MAG: sulfotransferase [Acidobacteriota bacterium]